MLDKWERCLSHAIGVRGVHINSALVSAQNRKRIYWSNIKVKDLGNTSLFDFSEDPFELPRYQTDIPQPKKRSIFINDILQENADDKYYLKDDTVSSLIQKTDKSKLKDYLLEPQVSIDEALEYMNANSEYSYLTDNEKQEIAEFGYEFEKKRLNNNYHGKEYYENNEESTCWYGLLYTIEKWWVYLKCPCITTGLAHYYSQKQLYPMVIEIYEKSSDSDTRS